jgi:hypothetical protein
MSVSVQAPCCFWSVYRFSADISALTPVLQNKKIGFMKSRNSSLSVEKTEAETYPWEKEMGRFHRDEGPLRNLLHGRAEAEFSICIYNRLGDYAKFVVVSCISNKSKIN